MEPSENHGYRTPFGDLTNQSNAGGQSESNSLAQVADPKERKRQRDRARRAAMSEEQRNEINSRKRCAAMTEHQRNEINRKRREACHRKRLNPRSLELPKMVMLHLILKTWEMPKIMTGYTGTIHINPCRLIKR